MFALELTWMYCYTKGFQRRERCWYVKVFASGNVAPGMLLGE